MNNLSYVINYAWNDKTLLPCPNYYEKKDGKNKTYYDIDLNVLTQNDIDNIYLIKTYNSDTITDKDPNFKFIISSQIHNEILNKLFLANNKTLDIQTEVPTIQTGEGKKGPKTLDEAKILMDAAKQDVDDILADWQEVQDKQDVDEEILKKGKNKSGNDFTARQRADLDRSILTKIKRGESLIEKMQKAVDKFHAAETLYNIFNSDLPFGWGDYEDLELKLHEFYDKITVVDVVFSEKFMSSDISIIYNKINKFLPQPYSPFKITEKQIIDAFIEMLKLNNASIDKKILRFSESCFDKGNNNVMRIEDIISEYIRGGDNKLIQTAYLFGKRVFCLNTYCYRFALDGSSSTTVKQRQECQKCTDARTGNTTNTDGYDIRINYSPNDDLYVVTMEQHDVVEILSRKYCVNNERMENGDILTQSVTYFLPELKKVDDFGDVIDTGERNVKIIRNKDGKDVEEFFYCPIDYKDYANLPSDIFETDHINGNHFDNTPSNLQRLCKICHAYKTFLSQDKGHLGLASLFNIVFGRIRDDSGEYEKYILQKISAYNDLIKDVKKDLTNIITVVKAQPIIAATPSSTVAKNGKKQSSKSVGKSLKNQ